MKTKVIMQRRFNGRVVRQDSKTGFLNLNDLYECYKGEDPEGKKRIDKYLEYSVTQEFVDVLRQAELEKVNSPCGGDFILPQISSPAIIETRRGKHGGTWVHPYLFLDFAMWLSPKFKLWAMTIIEDKLIEIRNEAGEKFKEMTAALKKAGAVSPREYMREANLMNELVFGNATPEQRNSASIEQLDQLNKLQKFNAYLIDSGKSYSLRQAECNNFIKFYNFIK